MTERHVKESGTVFFLTVLMSLISSTVRGLLPLSDHIGLSLILNEILLAAPAAVFLSRRCGKPPDSAGPASSFWSRVKQTIGLKPIPIVAVPLLVLLLYLLLPLIALVNLLSMMIFPNLIQNTVEQVIGDSSVFWAIVSMALIPALAEEFIFRGVIYSGGYRETHTVGGMWLCGLLFGLLHMNGNQFCYAFLLGTLFCFVMEATDSLLGPMIMHFTLNANSVILTSLLPQEISDVSVSDIFPSSPNSPGSPAFDQIEFSPGMRILVILGALLFVAVMTFLAYLIFRVIAEVCGRDDYLRKTFGKKSSTVWEAEFPTTRTQPVSFLSMPLICAIAICVAMMVLTQLGLA